VEVAPEKYRLHAHHWLILFGRDTYIVGARNASSPICADGRERR
jgi:endonuclease III